MTKRKISEFLNEELVDYASYDNLRKIASIMDGLKNSGRKVIHTTLEHNINQNLKVSSYSSRVSEHSEYLHGDISGVIVNLAKEYTGSNNLPLLHGKGNFGTRFSNEASATRYIFARKRDYLDEVFIKEDSKIVPEQYFEGAKIEPKFLVPTLPLLLINGSNGISSGFAQNILPRDTKEITDYLLKVLDGVNPREFPLPSFNGFNGDIIKGDTDRQFIIKGKVEKVSANRVLITEVPVQYELQSYIKVLDKLEEDKLIQGYTDLSNNSFRFEVRIPSKVLSGMSEMALLDYLKLTRTISENYTSLTHENKIKEYENPRDILDDYIDVKLEYTQKRKEYILSEIQKKLDYSNSKYKFIEAVVNDKLILAKRKKSDIIVDIDLLDVLKESNSLTRYDYLLRMPVSSMTSEELDKLKNEIEELEKEYKTLNKMEPKDIWISDIKKLNI